MTPCDTDGPAELTVNVHVADVPRTIPAGPTLTIVRSAAGRTAVVLDASLSPRSGSGVSARAPTVLVIVGTDWSKPAGTSAVTTTSRAADGPTSMVGIRHVAVASSQFAESKWTLVNPAGSWSAIRTLRATDGPSLPTVIVHRACVPGTIASTSARLATRTSARVRTSVSVEAVRPPLDGSGSTAGESIAAVLIRCVPRKSAGTLPDTVTVTAMLPPGAMSPSWHVSTSNTWPHAPWLGTATTGPMPDGRVSVSTTSAATDGPALVAVRLQAMGVPATTWAGAVLVSVRSASGVRSEVTLAVDGGAAGGAGVAVDTTTLLVTVDAVAAESTCTGTRMTTCPPAGMVPSAQLSTPALNAQVPWLVSGLAL